MIEPWWDLKTSMSREIGQTLIFWSNNMHSHPFEYTAADGEGHPVCRIGSVVLSSNMSRYDVEQMMQWC